MAVAQQPLAGAETLLTTQELTQTQMILRRFRKHKLAVVGVGALVFLFLFSFVGPLLSPFAPDEQFVNGARENAPPSSQTIFGTDELGRDVMTRLLWAGRVSLSLSVLVTLATTAIGVILGAVAGYFGGWIDTAIGRFIDFLLSLPILPLLFILSAMNLRGGLPLSTPEFLNRFFGYIWAMNAERAESILILAAILTFFSWMSIARLVRAQILTLRTMDFTDAARALGVSNWKIIMRHMVPNALAPIIVAATFGFGDVIITEAALSFVGFGVQAPTPSWGNMLNGVREFMLVQPWRAFIPGMAIFLTTLSFNFVGDALRDALDPRLKK
jgi:peptide/nickel transport system permease protein